MGSEGDEEATWGTLQSLLDDPRLVPQDKPEFRVEVGGTALLVRQHFDLQSRGLPPLEGIPAINTEAHSQTGSVLWDSSLAVAKYLEKQAPALRVAGSQCIELGAGTGLVGMALVVLGAEYVALTDRPEQMAVLREQVELNVLPRSPAQRVDVRPLLWGQPVAPDDSGRFDIIVAADCVYDPELVDPLLDSIAALAAPTAAVLVAFDSSIGRHGAYERFAAAAAARFRCREVALADRCSGYDKAAIRLFRLHLMSAEDGTDAQQDGS